MFLSELRSDIIEVAIRDERDRRSRSNNRIRNIEPTVDAQYVGIIYRIIRQDLLSIPHHARIASYTPEPGAKKGSAALRTVIQSRYTGLKNMSHH